MTTNDDAIFSPLYARELVARARDGATFSETWDMDLVPFWECERKMHEDHDQPYGWDERHWREWYRETDAAQCQVMRWRHTCADSNRLIFELEVLLVDFAESCGALGSLCQLPHEWAEAHRETARAIGG